MERQQCLEREAAERKATYRAEEKAENEKMKAKIMQKRKELAELTKYNEALEAMQTAKDPRPEQGRTKQSRRSNYAKYNAKRKPSKSDGMIPLSGNFVEMKNPVVSAS